MVRLALAIGFLAVFGFVAFVISVLLINHFKSKEEKKENPITKQSNQENHD